MTIQN